MLPHREWLWIVIPLCVAIYIYIAICIAPAHDPELHFDDEEGAITALSAIFLALASGFATVCLLLERNPIQGSRLFWFLTAFAFLFLSLDELLEFHEKLGDFIFRSAVGPVKIFRNWNDVIVIAYGVVSIFAFAYFLPIILRLPRFMELLIFGFAFYAIHTIVDSTQKRTSLSIILEESAKLFSSTFFAMAMLFAVFAVTAGKTIHPRSVEPSKIL